MRWTSRSMVVLAGWTIACGDDAGGAVSTDTSSDGPTTQFASSSEDGSTTSAGEDASTSTGSGADSSGGSESTTGETGNGQPGSARVLFTRGTAQDDDGVWAIDIVDGVPEPAIQIVHASQPSDTAPGGRWRIYDADAQHPTSIHVVDMQARPATPAVIVDVEDGTGFEAVDVETFAFDGSWVIVRALEAETQTTRHFSIALDDAGPGTPWPLSFEWDYPAIAVPVAEADRIAVVAPGETGGTQRLVTAPATASASPEVVEIATSTLSLAIAALAPDGRFLAFAESDEDSSAAFVVDTDAGTPVPVELEPPPGETLFSLRYSPAGTGIVARSTPDPAAEDPAFDLVWIAIDDDGVPAPSVPITSGRLQGLVDRVELWSDDGRWMLFRTLGPIEFLDYHLVRFDAAGPSEPFHVEASGSLARFSADGSRFYSRAAIDGGEHLARFDVSDDVPGPAQSVTGVVGLLWHMELSADDSTIVASWTARPSEPRELYLVDVSGDVPGAPVEISAPLGPEESVFLARVDRDASLVVYETAEPMPGPRRAYYVDLAGGDAAQPLGDGVDMAGLSLFELPP